jgi:xanthine dehydrogenase accessory factor
MDSVDLQVLKSTAQWLRQGRSVVLATVVETWGSAPRPAGALLAVRDDGQVAGSVSGGCVEDDLIERIRKRELAGDKPELTVYGITKEEAARFGLPCGGQLRIVLEPLREAPWLDQLLAACPPASWWRASSRSRRRSAVDRSQPQRQYDLRRQAAQDVHGPPGGCRHRRGPDLRYLARSARAGLQRDRATP